MSLACKFICVPFDNQSLALYHTHQLNNGFKIRDAVVKDKNGKVIEGEAEKIQRWKQHFESVFNRPDPP